MILVFTRSVIYQNNYCLSFCLHGSGAILSKVPVCVCACEIAVDLIYEDNVFF